MNIVAPRPSRLLIRFARSATLLAVGMLIACLVPLVLAGMTLLGLWRSPSDEELHDMLVEHFTGVTTISSRSLGSCGNSRTNWPPAWSSSTSTTTT